LSFEGFFGWSNICELSISPPEQSTLEYSILRMLLALPTDISQAVSNTLDYLSSSAASGEEKKCFKAMTLSENVKVLFKYVRRGQIS